MARTFEDQVATRDKVPLLVGIVGASGSGKTFSALRLATGIQRIAGGDIGVIDTEARRARHYADKFTFRHLDFGAPFGSLDYLAAIEHYAKKGVGTIVVDSMSHEHEGPGGVLEAHEAECARLMAAWRTTRDKVQMTAWAKPKAERRRLINTILQMPVSMIFCFRAKEKLKIVTGQNPIVLGWMPIAGEEFVYEMMVNFLLPPNSGGVPCWNPENHGERQMIKKPLQFEGLFSKQRPLDEDTGEAMAKWAAGDAKEVDQPTKQEAKPGNKFARLSELLDNAGMVSGEPRKEWVKKIIGHGIGSATDYEITQLEMEAEALTKQERDAGSDG